MSRQLMENELDPNPFAQFAKWFEEAKREIPVLPDGMTVSTSSSEGRCSSRICLLKDFDQRGFVFYTNYNSFKGAQIHDNPYASLCWWWAVLEREVRAEGAVVKVSAQESDEYWATRPRGSQIGAWASHQSEVILGRGDLEGRVREMEENYRGRPVPRPPHWGGYRVIPNLIEFWQGRPDRLHDRFVYRLRESKDWVIERISP